MNGYDSVVSSSIGGSV